MALFQLKLFKIYSPVGLQGLLTEAAVNPAPLKWAGVVDCDCRSLRCNRALRDRGGAAAGGFGEFGGSWRNPDACSLNLGTKTKNAFSLFSLSKYLYMKVLVLVFGPFRPETALRCEVCVLLILVVC